MRYECGICDDGCALRARWRDQHFAMRSFMTRIVVVAACITFTFLPQSGHAQDVPGIEICTVEKTMERRTSCLQSNVDFLQKTITKMTLDHQQKLDAANSQIDALMTSDVGLTKELGDLQAASAKSSEYTM